LYSQETLAKAMLCDSR